MNVFAYIVTAVSFESIYIFKVVKIAIRLLILTLNAVEIFSILFVLLNK